MTPEDIRRPPPDFEASDLNEEPPRPPRDRGIEVLDIVDLMAKEFPPPAQMSLVGDALIIRQGLTMLGGPPRIGKSLLCSNLAVSRLLHRSWLDYEVRPGRTLYLQAEVPEAWLKLRFSAMFLALGVAPGDVPRGQLQTVTKRGLFLDQGAGVDALTRVIETAGDAMGGAPDFTIIDPLSRFFSGDENSQYDVGRLVSTLDGFVEKYETAFLLPHHPSKPIKGDAREGGAKFRGMSGLWSASDATWWIEQEKDGPLTLSFEDLRHGIPPGKRRLIKTPGLWLEDAERPKYLDAVTNALCFAPLLHGKLCMAVQLALKVGSATAERYVAEALRRELVRKDDSGLYHHAIKAPSAGSDGKGMFQL